MTEIDFWFSIGSTYTFLSVNRISEVEKKENSNIIMYFIKILFVEVLGNNKF